MKNIFYFLLIPFFCFAQNDTLYKGKVSVETNDNDGVTIANLSKKTNTVSFNGGYFKIKANTNDTLIFSSINMYGKKIVVTAGSLKNDLNIVKMEIQQRLIKEIMISNANRVTPESLGLVPYGQKRYTTAERRLYTASDAFSMNQGVNLSVDAFINMLSGRTKQLKKELEIERKEMLQDRISKAYERDIITQQFKIPEEYIDGFLFYLAEDTKIMDAVKIRNKDQIYFRLQELAAEYIKLKNIIPEIKIESK